MRWSLFALLAFVAWPEAAAAQSDATAAALFDSGLAEMQAGNHAKGCPELAESQRLDPRLGTLFTLAECEAQWGKIASAAAHYRDYLAAVGRLSGPAAKAQKERGEVARRALGELRRDVPALILRLAKDAPADAVVRLDGTALGRPALGLPIPVDPGEHEIKVEVPGRASGVQRLTIGKGDKQEITLAVPPPPSSKGPAPAPAPKPAPRGPSAPVPERPSGSAQRTWGFIGVGAGALGLATGITAGVLTLQKKSVIEDRCDGSLCDRKGLDAADEAKTYGLISTIGFGVGLALGGAGVVLIATAPSDRAASAAPAGVALSGVW